MSRYAYVTCLIRNDSYLPGALLLAHSLREQETPADLVCLVTPEISHSARRSLARVYHRTVPVNAVQLNEARDQHRQHISSVMTRVNALRLGQDGDLGCNYARVVVLDADVLPIRCFDHLFSVEPPAGILNERREHLKGPRRQDGHRTDSPSHGRWCWHRVYRAIPHGWPIPEDITNRVRVDPSNLGINTAVLVLEPSMHEFRLICSDLAADDETARLIDGFRWPDMQYLTLFFSGRWHNVDACFAGLCGYPDMSVLFGTHFAGVKPWQFRNRSVAGCFSRYPDFQYWYREFDRMMAAQSELASNRRLVRLREFSLAAIRQPSFT